MTVRKNLDLSQTIFALTTGTLPTAVAVEKLSGPHAFSIANKIFRSQGGQPLEQKRGVVFGELSDLHGQKLDDIIAVTFVSPHSHSGEDTVEFHCHGSKAVIESLEAALIELGARPAERGEFSYRAFLNEKLSAEDLENLGDVFLAKQNVDLQRIYSRKDGALIGQIEVLRGHLIQLQAILDTAVDFSEEYSNVVQLAHQPLKMVTQGCSEIIQRYSGLKTGSISPKIVLAGKPNAGKSSLFNALLCRYRAIVHDEPGTTRDVIEEDIELDGRVWRLVDTAGFRPGAKGPEGEGISLGEDFLASSAFWMLVVDGTMSLSPEEESLLGSYGHIPHIVVWNKLDLSDWLPPDDKLSSKCLIGVSAKTGQGLTELWPQLCERLAKLSTTDTSPIPTATQVVKLHRVLSQLDELKLALARNDPPEYLSEQNRAILTGLEAVIGEVDIEEVLDRVFGEFCIGK